MSATENQITAEEETLTAEEEKVRARVPRPSKRIIRKMQYQAEREGDSFDSVFYRWFDPAEQAFDEKYPEFQ